MSATPNVLPATTVAAERVALAHPDLPGLHAWRVGNRVGEAPNWDPDTGTLMWIDVRAPAVLRLDPRSALVTRWVLPEVVGAMGLAGRGRVVLALRNRLAWLDLSTGLLVTLPAVPGEPDHNRLNDGKVSPSGRWFVFGSMDDRASDKQPTGALYCAGHDGSVTRLTVGPQDGLTVANGIAFSPDARTIYFSDSHAGKVWHAPWVEAAGAMGTPLLLCSPDDAAGRPDGAAVDTQGHYWSAGVSAACLNRYSAAGDLLERLRLPCRAPTMPCFGGAGLTDLYLTSLVRPGWTLGPQDLDGALFCWPSRSAGLPVPRWSSTPP
jgi:sugar lactone lactonase YvrE